MGLIAPGESADLEGPDGRRRGEQNPALQAQAWLLGVSRAPWAGGPWLSAGISDLVGPLWAQALLSVWLGGYLLHNSSCQCELEHPPTTTTHTHKLEVSTEIRKPADKQVCVSRGFL